MASHLTVGQDPPRWNLRDEIKADYKDAKGLEKQRALVKVMDRIVTQSIPRNVIDNPRLDWDPFTNKVSAGEDVENHTWTHPQLDTLDEARIRGELDRTERLLDTLGARPRRLMRPPYGVTEGALQQTLRHTHRAGMLWDVDPDDDPDPVMSIPDILATAMRQLHPGGVILLHPWYPENVATRAALPMLLDSLEGRGYRVVSLAQMARLHHARWRQAP